MVRSGEGHERPLRRPLSIHRIGDRGALALLFAVVGEGTRWLSRRGEGETLDLLGPLGRGFVIQPASRNLLLVAGGIGIAPLTALAQEAIASGRRATLLLGVETQAQLYPQGLLPPELQLSVATADGSAGKKGLVTDLLPDFIPTADQVFACGPIPMYRAIAALTKGSRPKSIQVLLEQMMGCGLGACYGCSVETRQGSKQVCRDGPVFELQDVIWEKVVEPGIGR